MRALTRRGKNAEKLPEKNRRSPIHATPAPPNLPRNAQLRRLCCNLKAARVPCCSGLGAYTQQLTMRAFSIGALVLTLLGRTTSFVFSSPAAVARLRNPAAAAARPNNARINKEKVPLPWATSASSARPSALSWPHPFAVRGGGRALRATDEPASAEASPRPALDVLAIGK